METIFNEKISEFNIENNKECKIITIEGLDGSGKTSTINNLVKKISERGYKAKYFSTSSSYNQFWSIIKVGMDKGIINNVQNQLLHNISFLTYCKSLLLDETKQSDYLLTDWYIYGKMVLSELYSSTEKNNALNLLEEYVNSRKIEMPDYSFYLNISPEEAFKRIQSRNGLYEHKEEKEMLIKAESIWDKYLDKYNIMKIDGDLSTDIITQKIMKKII